MKLKSNTKVKQLILGYPKLAQNHLLHIRDLIIEVAEGIDDLEELEETLKWGEPSYLTKYGSTIRMDWKEKYPNQYAIYLSVHHCLLLHLKHFIKAHLYLKAIGPLFLS